MASEPLLQLTPRGLYCAAGDFYIDPWQPVSRAVVTHPHSDHLCRECATYLMTPQSAGIARLRLGPQAVIRPLAYGEPLTTHGVTLSLHPAGHILGSAQVRVEHRGEVWVVSGDFKRQTDPTCAPYELLRCHTWITEATFALPIFRWPEPDAVAAEINQWWRANQAKGRASLLFGYPLGKTQRLAAMVDPGIGPIYTHGAVEQINAAYRQEGVLLPPTERAARLKGVDWSQALILAPLSARGSAWARRFGAQSQAFASGWMQIRGTRRRRAMDRGFVISDHADWEALNQTVRETGAEQVLTTHGYAAILARWLREQGVAAQPLDLPLRPAEEEDWAASEGEE